MCYLSFRSLDGKIYYTLIILLLNGLHELPLTADFVFILLHWLIFLTYIHYFVNLNCGLLFLLFRICKLREINLWSYGLVILLFNHTSNILGSEFSINDFCRGWKSNFWLKWRRQTEVLVWTSIESTAIFLKISVMSIVISLILKVLGTRWRGKFGHDLCVKVSGTIVFNKSLLFYIKHDQIDVLVTKFGQLYSFLDQTPFSLAIGYISRIFVLYFFDRFKFFLSHDERPIDDKFFNIKY